MLQIRAQVIEFLINHAMKNAPVEACGYLAERNGVIESHFPLTNVDASPEHFSLDPKEQFSAVRAIRSQGMKLIAVYHSHPASPARPSAEDLRLAVDPALSYVIVSLNGGKPVVKSFRIAAGVPAEEEIATL
jgi:proteasome lid subunit RPN8/RPN11